MKKNYDESGLVDYIRTLRKEKNITQEEVANRLGISRGMYVSCLLYTSDAADEL